MRIILLAILDRQNINQKSVFILASCITNNAHDYKKINVCIKAYGRHKATPEYSSDRLRLRRVEELTYMLVTRRLLHSACYRNNLRIKFTRMRNGCFLSFFECVPLMFYVVYVAIDLLITLSSDA